MVGPSTYGPVEYVPQPHLPYAPIHLNAPHSSHALTHFPWGPQPNDPRPTIPQHFYMGDPGGISIPLDAEEDELMTGPTFTQQAVTAQAPIQPNQHPLLAPPAYQQSQSSSSSSGPVQAAPPVQAVVPVPDMKPSPQLVLHMAKPEPKPAPAAATAPPSTPPPPPQTGTKIKSTEDHPMSDAKKAKPAAKPVMIHIIKPRRRKAKPVEVSSSSGGPPPPPPPPEAVGKIIAPSRTPVQIIRNSASACKTLSSSRVHKRRSRLSQNQRDGHQNCLGKDNKRYTSR